MKKPIVNPARVYMKVDFAGYKKGEVVTPCFQRIDTPDENGYDIWVHSKDTRFPKPEILLPFQYSLEPITDNI